MFCSFGDRQKNKEKIRENMIIECTELKMTREELDKKLKKPGMINKLITGRYEIERIELKYVEYLILYYRTIYGPLLPISFPGKKKVLAKQHALYEVRILGNGTTGYVSSLDEMPPLYKMDIPEGDIVHCEYREDDMHKDAYIMCVKVVRRNVGGRRPTFTRYKVQSIYRPFYAIYYKAQKKDGRVLVSSQAADGFHSPDLMGKVFNQFSAYAAAQMYGRWLQACLITTFF